MKLYYLHTCLLLATVTRLIVQFIYGIRVLLAIALFFLFLFLFIRLGVPRLLVGVISYIPAALVYLVVNFYLFSSQEGLLKLKVKAKRNLLVHYFNLNKPFKQPFILYLRPFNFDHSWLNTMDEYNPFSTDVASLPSYYYKGRPQYFEHKNSFDKIVIDLLRPWGDTMALISNADYEEENTIITTDENWESMFKYLCKHACFILCTPMHLLELKNQTVKNQGPLSILGNWPGTDSTSYNGFIKELNFLFTEKLLHKTILTFPAYSFCEHYDTINRACSEFNFVLPAKNSIKEPDLDYSLAGKNLTDFLKEFMVVIKTSDETGHEKSGLLIRVADKTNKKFKRKALAVYLKP